MKVIIYDERPEIVKSNNGPKLVKSLDNVPSDWLSNKLILERLGIASHLTVIGYDGPETVTIQQGRRSS